MFARKAYLPWILLAFLFTGAVLGYTAWLNVLSFQKNYTDSLVRSYALAGKGIAGKIEYALKYGKPLANFFGLGDLLAEVKQRLPAVENVQAVLPDGRIVADWNGPLTGRRLDANLVKKLTAAKSQLVANYFAVSQGERQHVVIAIMNQAKWAGSIDLVFANRLIQVTVNRFVRQLVIYLLVLSLAATLLFIGLFRFFVMEGPRKINPKRLQISLLIVLVLAQITYGYLNYTLFKTGYLDITRNNALISAQTIQSDIEAVIAKGATYGDFYQLNDYFKKIVGSIPEIAAIRLTGSAVRGLAATAGTPGSDDWQKAPAALIYAKRLRSDLQGEFCKLNLLLSQENINRKIRGLLLDAVTVLTISFFLMLELTLLVTMILRLRLQRGQAPLRENLWNYGGIRPLAFITYQAMFLTGTFVPVMMRTFKHPLAGLPADLALGLPVSVEMLCGLLATVAAGYWTDRKGWRATFVLGLTAFMIGTVLSGIAAAPLTFIVARGLAGTGTGLLVIAMRSCVILQASQDGNSGIAAMTAGATSGINCGVVSGALLADRIGFAGVFFIAGGLSLLALPFLLQKPTDSLETVAATDEAPQRRGRRGAGAFREFILNGHVLRFLGLILVPLAVSAMFLNYYFPLFASTIGVSASDTGRAFLLNGLCPVLLGPALSKLIGGKLGAGRAMIFAALLTGAAIAVFAAYGSLAAALTAIVALGVAESFGTAAQVEYFMDLTAVREYGQGKALSYFSLAGKLGNMLGPLAFGGAAFLGLTAGPGVIGGAILVTVCIFAAIAGNSLGRRASHGPG